MKLRYINTAGVKKFCKQEYGKRVSKDFLAQLDYYLQNKLRSACLEHNGGKKTLDNALAGYVLGRSGR
jgi:hypothetical protein